MLKAIFLDTGNRAIKSVLLGFTLVLLLPQLANANDTIPIDVKRLLLQGKHQVAAERLENLVTLDNNQARYQLAVLLLNNNTITPSNGNRNSISYAKQLLIDSSENSSDSAFLLGSLFLKGKQLEKDLVSAKKYLSIASIKGDKRAETLLQELELSSLRESRIKPQTQRLFELAVASGNLSLVIEKYLNGANLNHPNRDGNPPLHASINFGRQRITQWLALQNIDLNSRDTQGNSPLHLTAKLGQFENTVLLVKQQKNLNTTNKKHQTPLMLAIISGHQQLAQWLINKGADFNLRDNSGRSAADYNKNAKLNLTAKIAQEKREHQRSDIIAKQQQYYVQSLKLQSKNKGSPYYLWPSLAIAVAQDQQAIAKQLLKNGENPWARTTTNQCALSLSLQKNQFELVQLMLQDYPVSNQQDLVALEKLYFVAIEKNRSQLVSELIIRASELGKTDLLRLGLISVVEQQQMDSFEVLLKITKERIPEHLLLLSIAPSNTLITKRLLDKGMNINATDRNGDTALILAAKKRNIEAVQLLTERGATIDASDIEGQTALIWATKKNCRECIEILLAAGAQPSKATHTGNSAVMFAAQTSAEILSTLLTTDIDLSLRNKQSHTALMLAVNSECIDCMKILLLNGANPRRKNAKGQDAFDLANNDQKLLEILEQ